MADDWRVQPPHDCRSRGDCGRFAVYTQRLRRPASRLPQSRRLRPDCQLSGHGRRRPPHDCRSRGDCGLVPLRSFQKKLSRLTIAAVAATAAKKARAELLKHVIRLTIAAVAATAAFCGPAIHRGNDTASRLPQSRRLRHANILNMNSTLNRLTIAAVAATAARSLEHLENQHLPQHFASVRQVGALTHK